MGGLNIWIELSVAAAYTLLTLGVISQIRTTLRRGSVNDIDILEVTGRFVAQLLIAWKIYLVQDSTLIVGHTTRTVVYFIYFLIVVRYKYFSL